VYRYNCRITRKLPQADVPLTKCGSELE